MTQNQIREKTDKLATKIKKLKAKHKAELAPLYAKMDYYVQSCEHPNLKKYDIGYDQGGNCPDCGYSY